MKTHYMISALALLILLCCPKIIQAAQVKTQDIKTEIAKEEWDKKIQDVKTEELNNDLNKPSEDSEPVSKEVKETLPEVFNNKITLKGNGLPLKVFLGSIARATGHNVIYGPQIDTSLAISIDVEDVEVWRALNTILYPLSYGFKSNGHDLVILAEESRVYKITLPPVSQNFTDLTSNESFLKSSNRKTTDDNAKATQEIRVGTKILVENNLQNLSFWDDVEMNLKSLLSPNGRFSTNKPAGVILVSDLPVSLDKIGTYFDELNKKVAQQIEIEVKVVEVALTDQSQFGVDWNMLAKNLKGLNALSLATNFATQNFTSGSFLTFSGTAGNDNGGISTNGVNAVIKALNTYGKVEVVSQPKITILNNQVAVIQVGTTKSFIESSSTETSQVGSVSTISTGQVQEGVTMRLVGNIMNEQVYLSVTPVVTTIDSIRTVTSGNMTIEAPQTSTKSINTMVKLKEGETVAIGGLITGNVSDTTDSVPILSKIPVLGGLFKYKSTKNNKTELLIFITPRKG